MTHKEKIKQYGYLMRLHRPVGTILLGWSTLWGLWLAGSGQPPAWIVFILMMGTFAMRALGCVLNDLADRNFDAHVRRTQDRPLATGALKVWEALLLALLLLLINVYLVSYLNWQSVLFGVFCVAISAFYPLCKRFFILPQLVLGFAFAAPIPMADLAIHGRLSGAVLCLYLASVVWALIYDTFYALVDREDDLKLGLRSAAITIQGREKRFLSAMSIIMLFFLTLSAYLADLNAWYGGSVAVSAVLLAYEIYRIRDLSRERCFQAFIHSNWIGAAIWSGLVLCHLP